MRGAPGPSPLGTRVGGAPPAPITPLAPLPSRIRHHIQALKSALDSICESKCARPTGGHPHFRDKEPAIMIAATTRLQKSGGISARNGSRSVIFVNLYVGRQKNTPSPMSPGERVRNSVHFCGLTQ